jgi:hypothetical protein
MSLKTLAPAVFATFLSATLLAQGPPPGGFGGPAGFGGPRAPFGIGRGPMGPNLAGRAIVTGAPFSGTETVTHQETLADGNQISHQEQSTLSRDSQGRVRTEHTANAGNASTSNSTASSSASGSTGKTLVTIIDPVAGYSYVLNASSMTAMRMAIHVPSNSDQTIAGTTPQGPQGPRRGNGNRPAAQRDDLGTQVINGVSATGTRITTTIPAGIIGNQQALQTVREVWIAVDLKIAVLVKSTDPRGNTIAQLTDIAQGEPDPSLFQVPAGYTVTDAPARRGHQ